MKTAITALFILAGTICTAQGAKHQQTAANDTTARKSDTVARCTFKKCGQITKPGENLCRHHQNDNTVLWMTENEFNDYDLRTYAARLKPKK